MGWYHQFSLKARLSIALISIIILTFIGIFAFVLHHVSRDVGDSLKMANATLAKQYASEVDADLEVALDTARALAYAMQGYEAIPPEQRRSFFNTMMQNVIRSNPDFIAVWSGWEPGALDGLDAQFKQQAGSDDSGRFLSYWHWDDQQIHLEPLKHYAEPAQNNPYLPAIKSGEEMIMEPYDYLVGEKKTWITSLVVPIKNPASGQVIGAVGVDMAIDRYQKLYGQMKFGKSGRVRMLSQSGVVLAHEKDEQRGKVSEDLIQGKTATTVKNAIAKGEPLSLIMPSFSTGKMTYKSFSPIYVGKSRVAWSFVVAMPLNDLMASAVELRNMILLFATAGLVLIMAFLVWLIQRLVVEPMAQVTKHLADGSDQLMSVAQDVEGSSTRLSEATTEQAAGLQETVATLDQMSAMISRTVDSAIQSKQLSDLSAQATEAGLATVEKMLGSMTAIEEGNANVMLQVEQNNRDIQEIIKVISNIGEKTKVINDIVFQTKLLSFNASVEAARAGTHGKGFAVVAEEVGNLASMSGNAAKEISDLLGSSIQRVNRIIDETKNRMADLMITGKARIDDGKQTAVDCKHALDKIWSNVQKNNQMMEDVQKANAEQSAGIKEITQTMAQMDQITQQNSLLAQTSAANVRELNQAGDELISMVHELERLLYAQKSHRSASPSNVEELPAQSEHPKRFKSAA